MHRKSKPHDNIIIVDKSNPEIKKEFLRNPSTWLMNNDFLDVTTLKKAKIEKAKRIYITTNQDFVNVVCTSLLLDYFKNKHMPEIICQISDPYFRKDIKKLMSEKGKFDGVTFYNGYKAACEYFLMRYIEPQFLPDDKYIHVFLGYGNFAFSLHEVMLGTEHFRNEQFIIGTKKKEADRHNRWIYALEEKIINRFLNCKVQYTDIFDCAFWENCNQRAVNEKKQLVFYICTDNDLSNLQLSILLKENKLKMLSSSLIFIRCFNQLSHTMKELLELKLTENDKKDIVIMPLSEGLNQGFEKTFGELREY